MFERNIEKELVQWAESNIDTNFARKKKSCIFVVLL